MLPNPRLFRSRWAALLWAGGILWFAYDVAGAAPAGNTGAIADASGAAPDAADLAMAANLIDR